MGRSTPSGHARFSLCLRLRVVADPATVDQRFMLSAARAELLEQVIGQYWPKQIDPADIGSEALAETVRTARHKLLESLDLTILG